MQNSNGISLFETQLIESEVLVVLRQNMENVK